VLESGGKELILMTLASGKYDAACRKMGVRVASEGFADRAYNVDGTLVSRKIAGSLITDPERAAAQAVKMAMAGKVCTLDGVEIDISVQTICCHATRRAPRRSCGWSGKRSTRPGAAFGRCASGSRRPDRAARPVSLAEDRLAPWTSRGA